MVCALITIEQLLVFSYLGYAFLLCLSKKRHKRNSRETRERLLPEIQECSTFITSDYNDHFFMADNVRWFEKNRGIGAKGVISSKALLSCFNTCICFVWHTWQILWLTPRRVSSTQDTQSHYNKSSVEFQNEADDTDAKACTLRGKWCHRSLLKLYLFKSN